MKKYRVYAIASASWVAGEYEAESKEAALKLMDEDDDAAFNISICHQCSDKVEVGDADKFEAEEIF